MKFRLLSTALLALGAGWTPASAAGAKDSCCGPADAPSGAKGKLVRLTEKDAEWAAQQRDLYRLSTCVISGEKLGSMGKPAEFIYRVEKQPDRLVRFCCGGCTSEFMAAPADALQKIETGDAGSKTEPAGEAHAHHAP